ncbi:MAG: signal peptidase I [Puniceicoccales bacterium]|jgi:signal peptidase I|nr:signal peptidase I [Puniceicoccales bacterium]
MLSLFKRDPLKPLREQAGILLHHANKVWSYRRDVLNKDATGRLLAAHDKLDALAASKTATSEDLSASLEELDSVLRETGGNIYPVRLVPEWIELIVVATIIACGVRSFFLQPFKIPTNSMYPTYHGMTAEVFPLDSAGPGTAERIWRKLTLWTERIEVHSPVEGKVFIPLDSDDSPARLPDGLDGGLLGTGILASPTDTFYLMVGLEHRTVPVSVPKEFNFSNVVLRTYFPDEAKQAVSDSERWSLVLQNARKRGDLQLTADGRRVLRTDKTVSANGRLAHFDVLTGDRVLVDRMSYNFVRPSAGDPFVFATKNIPELADRYGRPQDLYYIKRLVGTPSDTLQVRAPVLYRNGKPIAGKAAFDKNNTRRSDLEYYGYLPFVGDRRAYPLYNELTIPRAHFFAMGDNSSNSYDSRGWGFVPEKEVIGRGFFILYPFTSRWGRAE